MKSQHLYSRMMIFGDGYQPTLGSIPAVRGRKNVGERVCRSPRTSELEAPTWEAKCPTMLDNLVFTPDMLEADAGYLCGQNVRIQLWRHIYIAGLLSGTSSGNAGPRTGKSGVKVGVLTRREPGGL